jgi:hypothetical protein
MTRSASLIDDAPKRAEEFRDAMDFVEDDQAILVLPQEESWLCEFASILPSFKVEVERPWTLVCDLSCQSCFTYLTRPDDSDSGLLSEGMLN